jgi:T5SS/PEP-CTERM-associated repeat protein
LVLAQEVDAGQSVDFAANSIGQFSNDLYSPSTLVLDAPAHMHASITGFTFADSLVLQGLFLTGATYDGTTLTVFASSVGPLRFKLSGDLAGLDPVVSGQSTIRFVAPTAGLLPSIAAPPSFSGAVGTAVLVPGIVVNAPFPLTLPNDQNVTVTVTATGADVGTLSAVFGGTTVLGTSLTLTGTLGTVERSLRTLAYTANAVEIDTLTVTVTDYAGSSAPSTITANINSPALSFDWANLAGGDFGDPANWTVNGASLGTPPGGANAAVFGPGTYAVSGDGAVGEILVIGTATLTGQVTAQGPAQGVTGPALTVDLGGALTLAGGAHLTAQQQATVGSLGSGLLTVMGGALALGDTATSLVVGEAFGSTGTILDLEQITAAGTVVVGEGGTGTIELRGVASSLSDVDGDIGQSTTGQGSVTVNGGSWANGIAGATTGGQLTVGDAGQGSLIINGAANGITGQVTAFNATIGAQAGSQGTVMLDGGELLVANTLASSSTLQVGAGGDGELTIDDGSEVAVGVASTPTVGTGVLLVGGTAGGRGRIQIGDLSALLVYGSAIVGGAAGDADVTVGSGTDDGALFSTLGSLSIDRTGHVALGGADATLRAGSLDIDAGGSVSGTGTISGLGGGNRTVGLVGIDNDGSIAASGGELLLYGSVTGSGQLAIGSGSMLTLQAAVGSGQTLAFGANGHALLNDARAFRGTITGFDADDVLELAGTHATGATWANGMLTIDADFGNIQLKVAGTYASNAFSVESDGLGGTNIVLAGGHGDVHMVTFDGLAYDFQAIGDFVAVQSTDAGHPWQIQIRTDSFPGATSITTGLAVAFGDHRATFAIGRSDTVYVDGVPDSALGVGAVQAFGDGSTLARLSPTEYQLSLGTGESVTIVDQGDYLDWAVGLGPHDGPGSVRGLLGSNSGQANDFQLPDGTVLPQPLSSDQLLTIYAAAWRVASEASLLDQPFSAQDQESALQHPASLGASGSFLHA